MSRHDWYRRSTWSKSDQAEFFDRLARIRIDNISTNSRSPHSNVDAIWSFSSTDLSKTIEFEAAGNLKRSWVTNGAARDWHAQQAADFLIHATEIKTIWVPYGEG